MKALAALLRERGLEPSGLIAIRNTLHPDDASADFRDIDDVVRAGAIDLYDRMQDGPRIPHGSRVLSFVGSGGGSATLTAFRRFMMRRQGIAPGDIVYHAEAAHLLHTFIGRAANPVFYDAIDEAGCEDLVGTLIVQWPQDEPMLNADDERLLIVRTR